jgi:hypothetical protein
MRLFVYHDPRGRVLSASKASVLSESIAHPFAQVAAGHGVLEVAPTPELEALDCHEICERYEVDVARKKLVRKAAPGPAPRAGAKAKRRPRRRSKDGENDG